MFYNNTDADNLIQNSKGAGMLSFSRRCISYCTLFFLDFKTSGLIRSCFIMQKMQKEQSLVNRQKRVKD